MKLSPNFSLYEMTRSATASRLGIKNADQVTGEIRRALDRLCSNVLQPIRNRFGPVRVNSGFRSPALNRAINGSLSSQHMRGEAADIEVMGVSNLDVARWIAESDLPFDQLILEFHDPDDGPNSGWIHVSHTGGLNRREVLTTARRAGVVIYARGLPE